MSVRLIGGRWEREKCLVLLNTEQWTVPQSSATQQRYYNGYERLDCSFGWEDDKLLTTWDLLLFNCILITFKCSVQLARGTEQKLPYKKSSASVSVTAKQGEHNSRVKDQGALTVFKHSAVNAQMHTDVVKATGWRISVPIFVRDSGQKLLRLPRDRGSNGNPAPCRNQTCASLWSSFKMKLRSFLSFLPRPIIDWGPDHVSMFSEIGIL